ncbi:MAG: DUF5367 family protein [Thermoanaerobaculia bacterium]
MKKNDKLLFGLFGLAFWILGTLAYEARGPQVFEASARQYWLNFALTPVVTAALCILIVRRRKIPAVEWASASLLIALPGMFGEAVLLSNFASFMPRMHLETAGRYGAFLFASYALFLTIAEIVTIRAASRQTLTA